MTKAQAQRILRLCRQHRLPKPQIRSEYGGRGYSVQWSMSRIKVRLNSFDAAWHFCRALYLEQKGRVLFE